MPSSPSVIPLTELAAILAPKAKAAGIAPPSYSRIKDAAYNGKFRTARNGHDRVVATRDLPAVLAAFGIPTSRRKRTPQG